MNRLGTLLIRSFCLLCALCAAAMAAASAAERDFWQALKKGELWRMSPGEVWRAYLQAEQIRSISGGILITGREESPSAEGAAEPKPLSRSYWFWTQHMHEQEWIKAWQFDRARTESLHYMQLAPYESMRLQRLSTMLYQAGSDSEPGRAQQLHSAYAEHVGRLLGVSPQEQPAKTDAAGRSISTLLWQGEHTAAMLESATVNHAPDYLRLTFAPTAQHLYYERTATDTLPTQQELPARVQQHGGFTRLGGFKSYTHHESGREKPYLPGWFAALCYYGLHDLDNFSPKRPKADYPGQYTERPLRSAKTGKKLLFRFEREYKRNKNLQTLVPEDAMESFVLDHYEKSASKMWRSFSALLSSGLPIICAGSSGCVLTAFAHSEDEHTFLDSCGQPIGVEQSYLHPGAIFTIIPGECPPEPPAESK